MTFLNTRGKSEESLKDVGEKKMSRKSKAANLDDEISRFFESTRLPLAERDHNIPNHKVRQPPLPDARSIRRMATRHLSVERSSLPPIELPGRPFLGFGEPGPRPSSPLKDPREDISVSDSRTRRQPQSELSRSTTYYTWSQSPGSPRRRLKPVIEPDLTIEGLKGSPGRGRARESPGKAGSNQLKNHHIRYCEKCSTRTADKGLHHSRIAREGDPIDTDVCGKPNISTKPVDHQRDLKSSSSRVYANHANLVSPRVSPRNAYTAELSDTQLPADPEVPLQTDMPDKSTAANKPFTEVLDALFENVQAEIPPLPTTDRPAQEVIGEESTVNQPVYQVASPLKNRPRGTPTAHGFEHSQQAVKGQMEQTQTNIERRHSPSYAKGVAIEYPQYTLTGIGKAYSPTVIAPLPPQAPNSGYGRPTTIYGQRFQFEDSGVDVPHIQDRDDLRSSRSRGSRSLTARPYGTPVSLEFRPSRGLERVQSNNMEPSQREGWLYNDYLHEKDVTEDVFEEQVAGDGYGTSRSQILDMDIQDGGQYDVHTPFTHHEDFGIPEKLNFDPHRLRPATICSYSPSFVGDLALPYQAQRNAGSTHRPVTARISRGDQPSLITNLSPGETARNFNRGHQPTVRGSSRGEQEVGARQDEDLGPVGFWKPNRLY